METVRRKIPVIYPEWTNLNSHDPGITLLELFAWLKEMEQYQLNRITPKIYESMLQLLGIELKGPSPSKTVAFFQNVSHISLPAGYRFQAVGGATFEVPENVCLGNTRVKNVFIFDGKSFFCVDEMLKEKDLSFQVFGEQPVDGTSALYIGLDRISVETELSLYLLFYDHYPIKRNSFSKDQTFLPRNVVFEYAARSEKGIVFRPLEVIKDETYALSVSGEIRFRLGSDMEPLDLNEQMSGCCWIRFRLLKQSCEEFSRLLSIHVDAVTLLQRRTLCEAEDFIAPRSAEFSFAPATWLGQNGGIAFLIRNTWGWVVHNDFIRQLKDPNNEKVITLNNLPADLAQDGSPNIRLLCYEREFSQHLILGESNGQPKQRFNIGCDDQILLNQLRMMVQEQCESDEFVWQEWHYIRNIVHAGPTDRVFTYDSKEHEIVFGDNIYGAVPEPGEKNIVMISCATTEGSNGNILADSLESTNFENMKISPYNIFPSAGGFDGDTATSAIKAFQEDLKTCTKAVTATDYETLACSTPGLRVFGVKAIPCYDPNNRQGDGEAKAIVTVVVMPYNESKFPKPDTHFLQAVQRNLEKYRLITTNVKVIGPSYVCVSVYVEIVLNNAHDMQAVSHIRAKIQQLFDIHTWVKDNCLHVGEAVQKNTIVKKISEILDVKRVKNIVLSIRGTEGYRDKYGNIQIPPHALPYLGDLEIRPIDLI